jgi:hypothetical protein
MRALLLASLAGIAAAPAKENSASDRVFAEVMLGQRKRKPRNPNKGRWGRLVPVRPNFERRVRRDIEGVYLRALGYPLTSRQYRRWRKGLVDLRALGIGSFHAEVLSNG